MHHEVKQKPEVMQRMHVVPAGQMGPARLKGSWTQRPADKCQEDTVLTFQDATSKSRVAENNDWGCWMHVSSLI